jgi:hypothetical protein
MDSYRDFEFEERMFLADGMLWDFQRKDLQSYLKRKYVLDVLYFMISMDGMGLVDDAIEFDFTFSNNIYLQNCYFQFLNFTGNEYKPNISARSAFENSTQF